MKPALNAPAGRREGIGSRTAGIRVLFAAGGTGGHIFPALAVAKALQSRWCRAEKSVGIAAPGRIEFVGAGRPIERQVIPAAGFALHTVAAAGLKGIRGWRRFRNVLVLPQSFWDTGKLLRSFRPDVVAGVGGYVAGPVMLEASLSGIPSLLIEPNASPGFTNRTLSRFVRAAAVGFPDAARFYGPKARVTGHPVRAEFSDVGPKQHAPPYSILILGGSQGSMAINTAVIDALPTLAGRPDVVSVVHQTGERDYARVRGAYEALCFPADIRAFIDDVAGAFQTADLVICRSGASTVAELAAAGKASLLIPFPDATDNHQLANARAMERAGGARVLEQRELTAATLAAAVAAMLEPDVLSGMDRAARTLARPDAADRIADLIEELAWRGNLAPAQGGKI